VVHAVHCRFSSRIAPFSPFRVKHAEMTVPATPPKRAVEPIPPPEEGGLRKRRGVDWERLMTHRSTSPDGLDLAFSPTGTAGYDDLRRSATSIELGSRPDRSGGFHRGRHSLKGGRGRREGPSAAPFAATNARRDPRAGRTINARSDRHARFTGSRSSSSGQDS
jgi:hypothetical protein